MRATDAETLLAIARELEGMRGEYPQLRDFSAATCCDPERLTLSFDHHTQASPKGAGWAAAAPSPQDDGIWLYLDLHDPASTAQLHTQAMVPEFHRGPMRVMFLLREGERTKSLYPALLGILSRHGIEPGPVA